MSLVSWFKGSPTYKNYTVSDVTDDTKQTGPLPVSLADIISALIGRSSTSTTATIPSGDTVSGVVDFRLYAMCGFSFPSSMDGTVVSFQTSHDGVTYQALYDTAGALVTITVAASQNADAPTQLSPWSYFKIVTSTTQTATSTVVGVALKG